MNDSQFLKIAKQAALEAGKVINKYSGNFGEKIVKEGDKSNFATKTDLEAEEIIVKILSSHFPEHNIIAEEQTNIDKKSKFTWVIDPMDGSIAFASGVPFFSVSIGLLEKNEPILGVILNVSSKNLYWAQKGKGVYLNNKSIHVTYKKTLDESVGVLDFGHHKNRQQKLNRYVTPLITKIGYAYSFGSGAASMAMVAQGILDLYIAQAWIWDFAAATVIVREAGGMVTDFEGNEPDWSKDRLEIVASNGLIHEQILEALKK